MEVNLDTSHSLIGPCGPLEQSVLGNIARHVVTTLLRCTSDFGENTSYCTTLSVVTANLHAVSDMDPNEP